MEKEIIKRLCSEEVIIFIANRHKIKSEILIAGFLTGDCHTFSILLENEREILRGLKNEFRPHFYETGPKHQEV